ITSRMSLRKGRIEPLREAHVIAPLALAVRRRLALLVDLLAREVEHVLGDRPDLGAGREQALIERTGVDQAPHVLERLTERAADRQEAVVPHHQAMLVAQVAQDARYLVRLLREPFKVVAGDLAMEMTAGLVDDLEPALGGTDHDTGRGMYMNHTVEVRA